MKTKAKYRIAMTAVAVLGVACMVLGAALYQARAADNEQQKKKDSAAIEEFDNFFQAMNRQFQEERRQSFEMLDNFFDDDFFTRSSEPFQEMERMRQKILGKMEENLKGAFDHSWEQWFENRFTDNDLLSGKGFIKEETQETKDAYIYRFTVPDLEKQQLDVNVSEDGITIKGNYRQQAEKRNTEKKVIARQESRRSIYERFSIPEDVDISKAEVRNKKDEIIVRLPRNTTSS